MTANLSQTDMDTHFEKRLGALWHELRGGLWHSTPSHRFRKIVEAREIQSDPPLPGEFVWHNRNGTSYARSIGGVSLFDFRDADWQRLCDFGQQDGWVQFFRAQQISTPIDECVSTVWLAMDRTRLRNFHSIADVTAHRCASGKALATKWMPCIEACVVGPIPLSACTHAVAVCAVDEKTWRRIEIIDLAALDDLEAQWSVQFAAKYELRARSEDEQTKAWF